MGLIHDYTITKRKDLEGETKRTRIKITEWLISQEEQTVSFERDVIFQFEKNKMERIKLFDKIF